MDTEYLNLVILQNSIGLVICGLIGAALTWLAKVLVKAEEEVFVFPAMLALVFFGLSATCGYHVAKVYVAPQTVLAERAAK